MGMASTNNSIVEYIVSAIILEKFEDAKLICEKFFIEKLSVLAFLYGIANVVVGNHEVYKNIFTQEEFKSELTKLSAKKFSDNDLDNLSQVEAQMLLENIIKDKYSNLFENGSSKSIII